jgi:hypothetical protein
LTRENAGLALALRAAEYGWDVNLYIEPKPENNAEETGQGMHPNISIVKEWVSLAEKVDIIVVMENGSFMKKLDMFRKRRRQSVRCFL